MTEFFWGKLVSGFKAIIIFAKHSIIDVWKGSKCAFFVSNSLHIGTNFRDLRVEVLESFQENYSGKATLGFFQNFFRRYFK